MKNELAKDTKTLQTMIQNVKEEYQKIGLNINKKKMKIMCNGRVANINSFKIENEETEMVEKFIYLGQVLKSDNDTEAEISRIQLGLDSILKIRRNTQRLYNTNKFVDKGIESVCNANNDIWWRNVGLTEKNVTKNKNNTTQNGTADARHYGKR